MLCLSVLFALYYIWDKSTGKDFFILEIICEIIVAILEGMIG